MYYYVTYRKITVNTVSSKYLASKISCNSTRAYLFTPEEGSCYAFSTRNNCCEFLASDGVIFQSVIKLFYMHQNLIAYNL